MRTAYWLLVLVVAISGTALVTQRAGAAAASATPVAPPTVEVSPIGTVKDVMKGIVDPSAMAIWDSVGAESAANGDVVEKAPKTDAEWAVIEHNALTLAEAANLLMTPGRPMSRPDEANSTSQPGAPELTPAQIEKKISDNRAEWVKHAKELQATAVKAMAAAKAHDKDGLLEVGEAIDSACESCHVVYWYPDEKKPK
jgi:cytochrome c556